MGDEIAKADTVLAPELPRPAGWIDGANTVDDGWRLAGWMVLPPHRPFDTIRATWNGHDLGAASAIDRPDLEEHLYWIRDVRQAGFCVEVPGGDAAGRIELTGERAGRPASKLSSTFIAPQLEEAEFPPALLTRRVSDLSGEGFRLSGLRAFTDVWDQIRRYKCNPRDLTVLDWGCGCGRVTRYLARAGVASLFGCDIDAEAIGWCTEHLAGTFDHCAPEPPLSYGDSEIDVVFAGSVFTHLTRHDQHRWLAEIRRILADDGLFVASIAGQYAISLGGSRLLRASDAPGSVIGRAVSLRKRIGLRRAGIIDRDPDSHLAGIAPDGFYRAVYQTRRYTEREWTRHFRIVSYIERGLAGHQDLVVLRPH